MSAYLRDAPPLTGVRLLLVVLLLLAVRRLETS